MTRIKDGRVIGSRAGTPIPDGWQDTFLVALEQTGLPKEAAKAIGISRAHAYRTKSADPEFSARWDDVLEASTDVLEQIATRRAAEGSDRLLEFILKARRPETYRENVHHDHEHAHVVSGELTLKALIGEAQPVQIEAAKRREAARLLLMGEEDVVESTAEDLPDDDYEDLPEVETDLIATD